MVSIADLFNPTFFMCLGIMILVVAILVVYFESKMRDQNHKIASMMSLVSTLAEEVGGVKHQLVSNGGAVFQNKPLVSVPLDVLNVSHHEPNLIEVSDDEETEYDDSDEEDESEHESEDDKDDNDDEDDTHDVKVIKLIVSEHEDNDIIPFEVDYAQEFEAENDVPENDVPEVTEEYIHEVLNLSYEPEEEIANESAAVSTLPSESELKTISVHADDEIIDYKKLQLPKLRSIVVEKGLASTIDVGKLKKPELLKMLGIE